MIPKTETAFVQEGTADRLEILLHNYLTLRRKKITDQSTDMVLDLGRELLELRENDSEVNFLTTMARLNIPATTARYYIGTYKKFGGYREIAKRLGVSKCRILTALTHQEIKSLMDGNSVCGLALSNVLTMPLTKLRLIFPELVQTRPYFKKADLTKGLKRRIVLFLFHIKFAFSALTGGHR